MICDTLRYGVCGNLKKCKYCELDRRNYKIKFKIDIGLERVPLLLKDKKYIVEFGEVINEKGETVQVGSVDYFLERYDEYAQCFTMNDEEILRNKEIT
jgi:hypothetical protein